MPSTPDLTDPAARTSSADPRLGDRLALHGGPPVRVDPLPSTSDAAGRRIGEEEIAAVTDVLRSGRLNSTVGPVTRALEAAFAERYGVAHAVASSSGTAALHLAVAAVDPDPGDEIIVTGLSDAGTVLPILAQNAVPVFADVDPDTGNLDPESVRAAITGRTRAILVVHLFGVAAPVERLRALADDHGLVLIEDCAQAYGTLTETGRPAGTVGRLGCFSLQQSKHITAGDGGLTITDDPELGRRARLFADKAWPRDTGERQHLFLGLNYRMTELQAAVAGAQLPKLSGVVADRKRTAERLVGGVADLSGVATAPVKGTSWWQFPLLLDVERVGSAFDWAPALRAEGIGANPGYLARPLYANELFIRRRTYGASGFPLPAAGAVLVEGGCPQTDRLVTGGRLLVIGWNENYTDSDVDDHIVAVRKVHAASGTFVSD